ncbi:MAG: flagellar hook-basal body protein [Lachnospiraceae bacterium]|nr:flagellar hook-basal body protein [Lachnospiraceae bacterium]
MMRSLWTAASGMKGQQTAVDTIANNLANVNTNGYKTQNTQFKSLLYQTLQSETTSANGETKPTTAQVGLGTRVASINSVFTDGALLASESQSDVAISGAGFFGVRGVDGQTYYTRNGNFVWTLNANGDSELTNNMGNPVLDTNGNTIVLANGIPTDTINISLDGEISYRNADGTYTDTNQAIGLWQFQNPTGLEKTNNSLFRATDASGAPQNEANGNLRPSRIAQGYLEGSNVNVADEMVNLIISQRAYELNSRAITVTDTMLGQANELKR